MSDSEDGYTVSSNCYNVFSGKISNPFSQSSFFLIYYFPPLSPPYTCILDLSLLVFVTSTSPKSSYVVVVSLKSHCSGIIVKHLMWRRQLFLELLYCHAPMYLLVVLIFFFGVLWKIVFDGKSLFFHLGFG